MNTDKVLVMGATGNIGSQTFRTLIEAGVTTTAYIRDEQKARQIFFPRRLNLVNYRSQLVTMTIRNNLEPLFLDIHV